MIGDPEPLHPDSDLSPPTMTAASTSTPERDGLSEKSKVCIANLVKHLAALQYPDLSVASYCLLNVECKSIESVLQIYN